MMDPKVALGARHEVRRVASDTAWNIAGQVLPGIVALVAIPFLVRGLGDERFGILGLAWTLVGYFSLFDLGLGRAVTRAAADCLARGDKDGFAEVVWTSWLTLAVMGVVLGAGLFLLAPWLDARALDLEGQLLIEADFAMRAVALTVPAVIVTAGARGVLEAAGEFRLINICRIPLAILLFATPWVLLSFTKNVGWHVSAISVTRVLGMFVYGALALRHEAALRKRIRWAKEQLRELLRYSSWVTVSNFVSPLMSVMDRFFVGSVLGVPLVVYYATPSELATRLLIVPAALSSVLFPRFAAARARSSNEQEERWYYRSAGLAIALLLSPAVVSGILLAPEVLRFWVSAEMAERGSGVLRWLLVGVLFNALAHVPYAHLQGIGQARITGLIHLVELPLYAAALMLASRTFGLAGVAIAWSGRTTVDFILLSHFAGRMGAPGVRRLTTVVVLTSVAAMSAAVVPSVGVRASLAGATVIATALLFYLGQRDGWLLRLSNAREQGQHG